MVDAEWDLTQVLDAGRAMTEEEDESLGGLAITRYRFQHAQQPRRPRIVRRIPVETGFVFTLTTMNPVTHPLPHPHLLQLHAAAMRVCRAAGMAMEQEEDWGSSDEEDSQPSGGEVDATYMVQRYLTELGNSEGDAAT